MESLLRILTIFVIHIEGMLWICVTSEMPFIVKTQMRTILNKDSALLLKNPLHSGLAI